MNRVTNKFGAVAFDTKEGVAVDFAMKALRTAVNDTIYTYNLSPEEIIAFEHHMLLELSTTCSENLIKRGIQIRAAERVALTS